ncbi:MAG: FKBP-type peptidyl-prolyl cis-trans isomerase 2 [Candidatus Krumholzibacteriia bacterium]|jgi:FKBP-type peptidyl-prolyl cis-trans isomerase 2
MIEAGKSVKVHYKGTLADGTVFDSSEGGDPIDFEIGSGQVIPGFDAAIRGMEVGQTEVVQIVCEEAYGEPREEMIGEIPRAELPEDLEPEVDMVLEMQSPEGNMPVRIVAVAEEAVTLDANHPLAGHDLTFELTLVEIS